MLRSTRYEQMRRYVADGMREDLGAELECSGGRQRLGREELQGMVVTRCEKDKGIERVEGDVCDAQAFGYRGPLLSSDRFTFQSTLSVPRCLAQRCMELDTVIVAYFSLQVPYCYGRVCTAGQEAI